MSLKKLLVIVWLFTLNLCLVNKVNAATISLRCTDTGTSRSSVSLAAAGISGRNYAIVFSGGKAYKSNIKVTRINGGQVFNFDSNIYAIEGGATQIPASFIQELRVEGYLREATTHRFVAAIAAICTVK